MNITLRKIHQEDLTAYKHWKMPGHKYHDFNGPYFKKSSAEEVDSDVASMFAKLAKGEVDPFAKKKIITNEQEDMIGEVSWYWKSEETLWLEIGVVIFDEKYWGKGIGEQSLRLWIQEIFESKSEIVRLGLSTWSGNLGMIKLAEKLGLKKEAEYRMARIVNGEHYDSISYGILREEWNTLGRIDK